MSIQRTRTARELVSAAGLRWGGRPARLALGAALALGLPSAVYAQDGQPGAAGAVRDPMRPDRTGDEPKVAVSEHMTVDLHVKDEELSNVLELLSIQTQKNIIASKSVSGKVTATLYGVTFYQALDAILHVNGFGYMENGNFIYVYTQEELKQIEAALKKRVAKVIKLNYLNAVDAKEFVSPLLSRDGGEIKTNSAAKDFNIPDKAPVGSDSYALSATIVVIDFEENIQAIEELIKEIDTRPQQVLVEATILQTALNEANAFGVDFSIIGDIDFTDFIGVGGPLAAANSLIRGGNGTDNGVSPSDNQAHAITSSPGNTSGPGTFKVGVVSNDVSIFLRMLDQVTDTQILSNPKILALNRQPSRVLVGRRVGYLNTTSTETSTTQSVEFLDTGTQLYFRPFVSTLGEIRMELKPQVSAAEIREVTDAGGAAVTIPDEVTQELVTNVNVKDGQTVVLGGLFTESTSFTRRQVPFLGDIPILGTAFRGNDDKTDRSEIIFLITPTIVTDAILASAADKADADIERLRAGSRQGLLPWSRDKMTASLNVGAERLAREGKYDEALWNIQRSLSLNSNQPEVYRLREKITGERETWPNRSMLDEAIGSEVDRRLDKIDPAPAPAPDYKPRGHKRVPRDPVEPGPSARTAPTAEPTPVAADFGNQGARTATAAATVTTTTLPTDDVVPPETSVRNLLPALRGKIELYSVENDGQLPKLGADGADGWSPMIRDGGAFATAPVNQYVGGPNAHKVVMGTAPDATFKTDYGWIFNPKTGELWAAGFDGADNPLPKTAATTAAAATAPATMTSPGTVTTSTPVSGATTGATGSLDAALEAMTSEPAPVDETATVPHGFATPAQEMDAFEDHAWSMWFGFSPNQFFQSLRQAHTVGATPITNVGVETETDSK